MVGCDLNFKNEYDFFLRNDDVFCVLKVGYVVFVLVVYMLCYWYIN